MTRPTWDETWLGVAQIVATRSLCVRAQVGAVIVDGSNRIIATGYNGPPAGLPHFSRPCSEWCAHSQCETAHTGYDDCVSLHAEANAIAVCDRSSRQGGSLYVTGHVCRDCAKLVANSGVVRVVVQPDTPRTYRQPLLSYKLLRDCGIAVVVLPPIHDYEGHDC